MFVIELADLRIGIRAHFPDAERLMQPYRVSGEEVDFTVLSTYRAIDAERGRSTDGIYTDGYLETVCLHREIGNRLPQYDAMLLHAATVSCDGKAYAFAAPSGTGKSTHIALWKKLFGDKIHIINGDKPIIRFTNNTPYAYGTPWAGKEGWQQNTCAPLQGLCFLRRGESNCIRPLSPSEAVPLLLPQILLPRDPLVAEKTLELADRLLHQTELWELYCTPDVNAAQTAYDAMVSGKSFRTNNG